MRSVILACVAALVFSNASASELRAVATIPDIAALVQIVGGDRVDVKTLARGYQDPHYLEAKPSFVVQLKRADLLAYVGLELEVGWLPLLLEGARNDRLLSGSDGLLGLSEGLTILEIPTGQVTRAAGDVHPDGNPHYWLDPRNQIPMSRTIAERLAVLDPEHAAGYRARQQEFERKWTAAVEEWNQRMQPWRGTRVVCYHKQWEYLFDWMGIDIAGYVEAKAGIPPAPRHVNELEKRMIAEDIGVIVMSNYFEPAAAKRLSAVTGAQLVVLPASVSGEDGLDDPFTFFEYLVTELETAFQEHAER